MSYNYCLTQFCETLVNLSSKNKQNCIKEDRTTSLKKMHFTITNARSSKIWQITRCSVVKVIFHERHEPQRFQCGRIKKIILNPSVLKNLQSNNSSDNFHSSYNFRSSKIAFKTANVITKYRTTLM